MKIQKVKPWQKIALMVLTLVIPMSAVMVAFLRTKYQEPVQTRITRQMIETAKDDYMGQYQVEELTDEQQYLTQQADDMFLGFYQALDDNADIDVLSQELTTSLYAVSVYLNQIIEEYNIDMGYVANDTLLRGTIKVILTAGLQSTIMSALVGATVYAYASYCIMLVCMAILPVVWIPIVGQILFGVGSVIGTVLAGYLWDKYGMADYLDMKFSDFSFIAASGFFVPNFTLSI
jgi:hypothetical protein